MTTVAEVMRAYLQSAGGKVTVDQIVHHFNDKFHGQWQESTIRDGATFDFVVNNPKAYKEGRPKFVFRNYDDGTLELYDEAVHGPNKWAPSITDKKVTEVEETRAMANFHLRFSADDIPQWAGNYKDSDDTPTRLGKMAKARGFITREEFLAIGKWKSPRSRPHQERNEDEFVREVTGVALGTTGERLRIEVLTLLDGVDWPTASVLLHFAHHERYPILDFRALWSLSIEQAPSQYDFEFWSEYTRFCRDLADRAGVDMRTLDRALWEYSKENQPAE